MRKAVFPSVVLLLMVFSSSVSAQSGTPQFGIYGIFSIPTGDFGSDSGEKAGFATSGLGGGIRMSFPRSLSPTGEYSFVMSISLIMNGVDQEKIESLYYDDLFYTFQYVDPDLYLDPIKMNVGKYVNVPLMGGVSGAVVVSPTVKLSGSFMTGVNFGRIPKLEFPMRIWDDLNSVYYSGKAEIESTEILTSLCFSVGGSIIINEKFEIGFQYLNLGNPSGEGEMTLTLEGVSGTEYFDFEQPMSMMMFTVGVNF